MNKAITSQNNNCLPTIQTPWEISLPSTKNIISVGAVGTGAAITALALKTIGVAFLAAVPLWPLAAAIVLFSIALIAGLALRNHLLTTPINERATVSIPYENSVWVDDWQANLDAAQFIQALPAGVNTINIFVGQLDLVNNEPTIDGFSEDTPNRPAGMGAFPNVAALTDFISQCKTQNPQLAIKLSIGGQSGTNFGNSWNRLTAQNLNQYAQAMVNFCKTTGADGIDFDNELESTSVAALVGQLAVQVKKINPLIKTSYCVFGGINAQGPMHQTNAVALQNATVNGVCAIDRVYVMSYYDGWTLQQNETAMGYWSSWLKENCGMSPSQISCGLDPNDPNTSPSNGGLSEYVHFAASNGFSTAIWDQQGVFDYIQNNWGQQVEELYQSEGQLPAHFG